MSNTIVVHRLDGPPIELAREQCWFFDRSRYKQGKTCEQKREYQYHWGGQGVDSAYRSEDLALGSAVHAGLEQMLAWKDGEEEEQFALGTQSLSEACANLTRQTMLESAAQGMALQDDEGFASTLPELAQLLAEEQAALAYALVWTFGRRHLASLLERYEVVAVEPEICWLVGTIEGSEGLVWDIVNEHEKIMDYTKHIVMMSRPDAVLRDRQTGKLWVVSWKTTKRFTGESVEKLECDLQGLTEAMAVRALYQEEVGGTFYTYLVKGDKYFDKETGVKRYTSPLVRPYSMWMGVGEPSYSVQTERAKGWARCDVWKQMAMSEWMERLDGWVDVDPLAEAVAEPMPVPFNSWHAERWLMEAIQTESDWMKVAAGDRVVTRDDGACFTWGKRCAFFNICWRGETIEEHLASGRKVMRVSNHPAENGGGE